MRRDLVLALALAAGLSVEWYLGQSDARENEPPEPSGGQFAVPDKSDGPPTLESLVAGKLALVDLTWPLSERGAFWPGDDYKPFELRTIATLEKNGVLSKAFCMPEHQGTHLDAPNHFTARQPSVDEIPLQDLFAQGVVIDVRTQAAADPDYRLSLADITAWERKHGPIPRRAIVLANNGWGQHFLNPPRYRNQDVMGKMHFPGFASETVQFLIRDRDIRGIGIDTLSIDHGPSRDFPVHHVLGAAGRYGLENLAALDKLPPRGFYLFVAPIKIETGSGGPARVIAVLP